MSRETEGSRQGIKNQDSRWAGSWLLALGSWLLALGSWLLALGSTPGVLALFQNLEQRARIHSRLIG
jgi:hypothetical protein